MPRLVTGLHRRLISTVPALWSSDARQRYFPGINQRGRNLEHGLHRTAERLGDSTIRGAVLLPQLEAGRHDGGRDIQAETELRDREAKLRGLVQTLDLAAIMARDMDGVIQFWSKGCERLYGWTSQEVIGRKVEDVLGTEYPMPRQEIEAILIKAGSWSGDFVQRRRDGYLLTVAVQKIIQRDEDGRPVAVLESLSDVTALRQARLELTRLNEHLESRIRDEIAAREAAQVRAAHAERMQALGQLAGGTAGSRVVSPPKAKQP